MSDTKTDLLNAAEDLFAQKGFAQTALRAVTQAAEANLASVNYHFGSKEGLVAAVLDRRLRPINNERLRRLGELEDRSGKAGPSLEEILKAFVEPAFHLSQENEAFGSFLGRLHFEQDPAAQRLLYEAFESAVERFFVAFQTCLPELPPGQLMMRMHFAIGSMAMTVCNYKVQEQRLREMVATGHASPELLDTLAPSKRMDLLIHFLAHGFRAPVTDSAGLETVRRPRRSL